MPNSLTKVLSFTLVFSTCLPVSVYGTDRLASSFRHFSWQLGINHFRPFWTRLQHLRLLTRIFLCKSMPYMFFTSHHPEAGLPFCVLPSLHNPSTGILTCCPSSTPLDLDLGPTNPTRIDLPSETLDFRWGWFSHPSRYSYQHSHFCQPSPLLSVWLVSLTERSPTV